LILVKYAQNPAGKCPPVDANGIALRLILIVYYRVTVISVTEL